MKNRKTDQAKKYTETKEMTHKKTDYTNAPGCKKLGIRKAKPVIDDKTKELMVLGYDDQGPVIISREEALILMDYLPSPAEIEIRKRECQFLFPDTHRERMNRMKEGPYTVPQIFRFMGDVEHNRKKAKGT